MKEKYLTDTEKCCNSTAASRCWLSDGSNICCNIVISTVLESYFISSM